MPLKLVIGPPNSGRAGAIRRGFASSLERAPVLTVPTLDDVFAFERELSEDRAALGGTVTTFGGLFREVARSAGSPPGAELTEAQRLRAVARAAAECRGRLRPLRRAVGRRGFPAAFLRLLDELQSAGLEPGDIEAGAGTLEGSAYLSDLARLFAAYVEVREGCGRGDPHSVARGAIAALRSDGADWQRPVLLYGFDDLTGNQLALVEALAQRAEVTVAVPYEQGRATLAARERLLSQLRAIGPSEEIRLQPNPANTPNPLLFDIERRLGEPAAAPTPPGAEIVILRSAGARGEAESLGAEVARLLADGSDPSQIAIVLRDPARRGPLVASVLEAYGIPTALEATLPAAGSAVGGCLAALLDAEFGPGRSSDLLRYMRGPSGLRPHLVDWLERAVRQSRVSTAAAALECWREQGREDPRDLLRLREAAGQSAAELALALGRLAPTMSLRHLSGGEDGTQPLPGDDLEIRAAAAVAPARAVRAETPALLPRADELADLVRGIEFRCWSGPAQGRVRIASPYALRAARYDHVLVASLQDGEWPRHDRSRDPFLSEGQRLSLGLEPRRDTAAEELYLFYVSITRARSGLSLSYRESDEAGGAEARSPLLDEVRRLLAPAPSGEPPDSVELELTRDRDLAQVVHEPSAAPSPVELARSLAAAGGDDRAAALSAVAEPGVAAAIAARLDAARRTGEATCAPGPLLSPAVVEALAAVPAYGGTTLEEFDLCSYRWFANHELEPQPLDPIPDPLRQGGLMHEALDRLYRARPGGDPLPRPASLAAWLERAGDIVAEVAAERGMGGHPAERAMVTRVDRLLARFLQEEAQRDPGAFEPWRLEARFGDGEECEQPALELDGWRLHGAIDRVDRDPEGRALVIDYKLAGKVTPRAKLEEQAKLQLQLYLLAVEELWGLAPAGALYHPLRATSSREPRGIVRDDAVAAMPGLGLVGSDVVDAAGFEATLEEARERAAAAVERMRAGQIRRDPGPRAGLRGHGVCPAYCDLAPICRRDRAPASEEPDAQVEEP